MADINGIVLPVNAHSQHLYAGRRDLVITINGDPGRLGALNEWMVDHSERECGSGTLPRSPQRGKHAELLNRAQVAGRYEVLPVAIPLAEARAPSFSPPVWVIHGPRHFCSHCPQSPIHGPVTAD